MSVAKLYQLFNDSLASHQKVNLALAYKITGAKTGAFLNPTPQCIVGYDAADFTQAACDALLGTTNEFITTTAFASVAMGTDAMGIIINLGAQAAVIADCFLEINANLAGTGTADVVQGQTSALPNTLAAPARMQIGANGNVAIQFVKTGLDAAASGIIVFNLSLQMK